MGCLMRGNVNFSHIAADLHERNRVQGADEELEKQ